MKTTLNRQIFTQRVFDSGSLGALESVVHQFTRPGTYLVEVRRAGAAAGTQTFVVAEQGATQLDVDLAAPGHDHSPGCTCHESAAQRTVAPAGYVLFHATRGSGYSVRVSQATDKDAEFDSERLKDGDLFALCLLEPTQYTMTDRLGRGRGQITVSYSDKDAKQLRNLQATYIDVTSDGFKPANPSVVSTQGIVFRVKGTARVVIEKGKSVSAEKDAPVKPSVHKAPARPKPKAKRAKS
jgi:hypothetical protein